MNKTFRWVLGVAACVLAGPLFAIAQDALPVGETELTGDLQVRRSVLPTVHVRDVEVEVVDGKLNGSFYAINSEDGQVEVLYELQVISPRAEIQPGETIVDAPLMYHRSEPFHIPALRSQEKREVTFKDDAPSLPEGTYRLRVQLVTEYDRELGWGDAEVDLAGRSIFVTIPNSIVRASGINPISGERAEEWSSLEGPVLQGGQDFSIEATPSLLNVLGQNIQVNPEIYVRRLFGEDDAVQHDVGGLSFDLSPGENEAVAVPIKAADRPGAYAVFMTFVDSTGQSVSGVQEYRYVVEGQSASLASVVVKSLPGEDSNEAVIAVSLVGSSDVNTDGEVVIEAEILSSKGEVLNSATKTLDLNFAEGALQEGEFTLPVTEDVCEPVVARITLKDLEGNVLDSTEQVGARHDPDEGCAVGNEEVGDERVDAGGMSGRKLWIALVGVLAVAGVLTSLIAMRRKQKRAGSSISSGTIAVLMLAVLVGGGVLGVYVESANADDQGYWTSFARRSKGNGFQYGRTRNKYGIQSDVWVNSPIHDETLSSGEVVYEARAQLIYCDNRSADIFLDGYYLENGGKVGDDNPRALFEGDWFQFAAATEQSDTVKTCQGFGGKCQRYSRTSIVSSVLVPEPLPEAMTFAVRQTDTYIPNEVLHYTWVNFAVDPEVTLRLDGRSDPEELQSIDGDHVLSWETENMDGGTCTASGVNVNGGDIGWRGDKDPHGGEESIEVGLGETFYRVECENKFGRRATDDIHINGYLPAFAKIVGPDQVNFLDTIQVYAALPVNGAVEQNQSNAADTNGDGKVTNDDAFLSKNQYSDVDGDGLGNTKTDRTLIGKHVNPNNFRAWEAFLVVLGDREALELGGNVTRVSASTPAYRTTLQDTGETYYLFRLTVRDAAGGVATDEKIVEVADVPDTVSTPTPTPLTDSSPPVELIEPAELTVSILAPDSVVRGDSFTATSVENYDTATRVWTVKLDDGLTTVPPTGATSKNIPVTANHSETTAYLLEVTVTDTATNQVVTATKTVTVTEQTSAGGGGGFNPGDIREVQ